MNCPRCGAEASGNFCSSCGAALSGAPCPSCGHRSQAGARFCNRCGTSLAGTPAAGGSPAGTQPTPGGGSTTLAWAISGVLLVALIVAIAVPVLRREETPPPAAGIGALGPAPQVDLSSMTPREAADRLFDRVMRAASAGDLAQVQQFLPMAVAAYERAEPLDLDGRFHLAVLLTEGLRNEEALAVAEEGLAEDENHLLLLAAAADAAGQLGDTAKARTYYERLLARWDDEVARDLEEYQAHQGLLPNIKEQAETALARMNEAGEGGPDA